MDDPRTVDLVGLASAVEKHATTERCLIAIAGPPGAGKSTLADALVERLNLRDPAAASVIPMDGYRYDDGSSPFRYGPVGHLSRRPIGRSPGSHTRDVRTCQGLRPRRAR